VGYRPTFGTDEQLSIETFLLGPISGPTPKRIRLYFLRRLRDEKRFENAAALKEQILKDARRATNYHRRLAKWAAAAPCYTGA
jgi:riboflavin kinase/FMN adenylyltransferase